MVVCESDPRPARSGDLRDLITGQCWYAPRPCTQWVVPGLQPRGPSLDQGFRLAR
jgi:hypothetical protein